MRSARSRGSRARRVDRVNGAAPFDALEGAELVGGDRVRFDTAAPPNRARRLDAARGPDDLVVSRELRKECPLSRRKTCPDLAPCRHRVGRLSWHRRAGPSATLDKALFGCPEMMPERPGRRKQYGRRLRTVRDASLKLLGSLPPMEWQRVAMHSESGAASVGRSLDIYAEHGHEHADEVRRACAPRIDWACPPRDGLVGGDGD